MTTSDVTGQAPLWFAIEERIRNLGSHHLAEDNLENAIQDLAKDLDAAGYAVSTNAGRMLAVRESVDARVSAGKPLMEELDAALGGLVLEDLGSPYEATRRLIQDVGKSWPALRDSERGSHLLSLVESTKLELLVAKAREVGGDGGIRLLIGEGIEKDVVVEQLAIAEDEFHRVLAEIKAERAERNRVADLLRGLSGKTADEKTRHLIGADVSEELISEMAGIDGEAIATVKRAMEEELAEKQRQAEEAAAKKAAEAEGPSLDEISSEDMLDHIEALREILEFSDVEKEIRIMAEQSGVPKALVDIVVSDPDRLDELEAEAGG